MANNNRNKNEDLDSILSNIMRGEDRNNPSTHSKKQTDQAKKPKKKHKKDADKQKQPRTKQFDAIAVSQYYSKKLYRNKKFKLGLLAICSLLILAIFAIGGNKILSSVLSPSPFNGEIKQSVDYPLYYPKQLPDGFKIETESISEADDGVIVYAISDENGKRITITAQKLPEGVNLDSLYSALTDVYELDTPLGPAKIGKSDNILIANILTDETWILINTPNGNVNTDELNIVLQNLSEG